MEKQQQNFRSQNPSPPPYESSISSFSPSSFSHDGEGPEHSLHPSPAPQKEISRKQSTKRTGDDQVLKKVNFWFRVFGFLFCLISFSIMAADRDKGWTLDSFHRYIEFRYVWDLLFSFLGWLLQENIDYMLGISPTHEFGSKETKNLWESKKKQKADWPIHKIIWSCCRYCLTVNVIGFIYSALQGFDLAYQLFSSDGNKLLVPASHLRNIVDFASDQVSFSVYFWLSFCFILLEFIIFYRSWSGPV